MKLHELAIGSSFTLLRTGDSYKLRSYNSHMKRRCEVWCNKKKEITDLSDQCKVINMETKQNWYFTFGFGQTHANCYHKIHGTALSACKVMVERFDDKWSMQYSEKEFAGQAEKYNLKEIK